MRTRSSGRPRRSSSSSVACGSLVAEADQPAAGQRLHGDGAEGGQPRRLGGEVGRQEEPVGRREAGDGGDVAAGVDGEGAAADPGDDGGGVRAQPLERRGVLAADLGGGQPGGDADEGEHGALDGVRRAADVDGPQRPAGPRVEHRGRGAAPAGVGLDVVLGAVDVHGLADDQAGADRVGADVGLGPRGALDEAEAVGEASYAGAAPPPQDPAVGVGDDHQQAVVDDRGQGGGDARQQRGEGAGGPAGLDLALGQRGDGGLGARAPARRPGRGATRR